MSRAAIPTSPKVRSLRCRSSRGCGDSPRLLHRKADDSLRVFLDGEAPAEDDVDCFRAWDDVEEEQEDDFHQGISKRREGEEQHGREGPKLDQIDGELIVEAYEKDGENLTLDRRRPSNRSSTT